MFVRFRFFLSADYTKDLFGLQFPTLEGGKELEPNCVPHLFLGTLLGTSRLAIGQFLSLSLVTVPEVFSKLYLDYEESPFFHRNSRASEHERARKSPHARKARRGGEREK